MSILVVDAGTTSVRAAVVRPDGSVHALHRRSLAVATPAPGFVEFDAAALAGAGLAVARAALDEAGPVEGVGITNQRASTVVWDRATGGPVARGIGWQDIRTVPWCLSLKEAGVRVAPNTSATKLAVLLDIADPDRRRDLCFGTVDCWLAWTLCAGSVHVTDATNAALTGLVTSDARQWDAPVIDALRIPPSVLPEIVDTSGVVAPATALPGAPPLAALAGDQQASMMGQGCTRPGLAKATFGTGAMLDVCVGRERPGFAARGPHGCFPVVAWRRGGRDTWAVEAAMLTAGSAVAWLRDGLGLLASVEESGEVAAGVPSAGDVRFVPALMGLGTPQWDFGARGALLGLSLDTDRRHVVRAVLEGVAHRGADLLDAAEADAGVRVPALRVDGGMSANATFVQALADAVARPVELSPVLEATTLGAAYLAGMAVGTWADEDEVAGSWRPRQVVEPRRRADRAGWHEAVERARAQIPGLSALDL